MIRTDFVSNSSSSSFCIIGRCYDFEDLKQMAIDKGIIKSKEYSYYYDTMETILKHYELTDYNFNIGGESYGDECVIIGKSYTRMKSDQTRQEFENEIKNDLDKLSIECSAKIEMHQDCYSHT